MYLVLYLVLCTVVCVECLNKCFDTIFLINVQIYPHHIFAAHGSYNFYSIIVTQLNTLTEGVSTAPAPSRKLSQHRAFERLMFEVRIVM